MVVAVLSGTGHALPDTIMKNEALDVRLGTASGWLEQRTGIRARRILAEGDTLVELAATAGRRALAAAGIEASAIDLVMVATVTGDHVTPSVAAGVSAALGVACAAVDLGAACAGFVYAAAFARAHIVSGAAKTVLVIGAERCSRVLDWDDRDTAALFGDGAGAAVMQAAPGDEGGVRAVYLGGDGRYGACLKVTSDEAGRPQHLQMNGREVYRQAVRRIAAVVERVCADAGWTLAQVDRVVPHQANLRVLQGVARRLGVPEALFVVDLVERGNTSAASIPLALDSAVRRGELKRGDRVVLAGLGAGLVWGGLALRWGWPDDDGLTACAPIEY